jgi:hypothetical protein
MSDSDRDTWDAGLALFRTSKGVFADTRPVALIRWRGYSMLAHSTLETDARWTRSGSRFRKTVMAEE